MSTPDAIGKILLPRPTAIKCRSGPVADVDLRNGAFMIYHEGGRRYIPIKFSVRGRDLASAIQDLQPAVDPQSQTSHRVQLHLGWRVR